MQSALLAGQLSVAGLSLGAFSATLDLISTVQAGFSAWEQISNLDEDADFFRTQLLLQKHVLKSWQTDWYGTSLNVQPTVGKLRLLRAHDEAVRQTLRIVDNEMVKLVPMRLLEGAGVAATATDRVKWLASQKESAKASLTKIETLLKSLFMILPLQSPHVEAQIMVALLQGASSASSNIVANVQTDSQPLSLVSKAFRLQGLNTRLNAELESRIVNWQTVAPNVSDLTTSRPEGLAIEPGTAGTRSRGTRAGRELLVEWKDYAALQGQDGIKLRGRRDILVRMLKASEKPEEMLTLPCLGYFDDVQEKRYGFVFESPAGVGEDILSLNKLLSEPRTEEFPTLEQRYQMAYSLGLSLSIFFATNWLHKGLRSHNILFVRKGHDVRWSQPYVCGFAYSRPDKPNEMSEKLEHSERFNLYRHPLSQNTPRENYRTSFDMYSFGVILFEIAAWRPAFHLWSHDANKFRKEIMRDNHLKRVAHWMGVDYRDAMLKCLDGSFESDESVAAKAFFTEVVEILRRYAFG